MDVKKRKDNRVQRRLYQFWIDEAKPDMKTITKQFNRWRSHRKLTAWILDMWRLWEDLAAGEVGVLFELFPNVHDKLMPQSPSTSDLVREFQSIIDEAFQKHQLATVQPVSGGIQEMNVPKLTAPTFEDEDKIELKVDASAGTVSSSNFLDAAFGFQDVEVDLNAGELHE